MKGRTLKQTLMALIAVSCLALPVFAASEEESPLALVPQPAKVERGGGAFQLKAGTRIEFDLRTGTFNVTAGGTLAISNAHAVVESWSSTDPGYQRKITGQSDSRLMIECSRPDAPTLLLEFTQHPEFVELRTGLKNTTDKPVRIKTFQPLTGGVVFPGAGGTDVRTLNGPSGGNQTRVTNRPICSSANNMLLTFKQAGVRRSLVLGALKTADFTKWARTVPSSLALERPGLHVVSYLDCGGTGTSLFKVVRGKTFTWAGTTAPAGSVLFDEEAVKLRVEQLDPQKHYALGFSWWDQDGNGRVESVIVSGRPLIAKCPVPRQPERPILSLPAETYQDGNLDIAFTNDAKVPNAVVSEIWLWETAANAQLPTRLDDGPVTAVVEGNDPVGKLVEPGETYLPADSFYVDAGMANPFEALEQYGRALREATGAKPNPYDFPTVCAWYAGCYYNHPSGKVPDAQQNPAKTLYRLNTTPGIVEEMQKAKASGFSNYSRMAGRLVPDMYNPNNPQGWWDDAHWQRDGYYVTPYETSEKFGAGVHREGGLAFTYIQPTCLWANSYISKDFRELHSGWLCGKAANRTLDYSQGDVQTYLRKTFGALRGNIDGLMVDYSDDLWESEACKGGFADPHMTGTAFYRMFFRCVKDGLGAHSWLHERNVNQPNNDLNLGIVDSQRTSWDSTLITPDLVSCSSLRWYKNRVVLAYDMDAKSLTGAWKNKGWTGTDQDGRRMLLTMAYVAASRLLTANSFRDLDAATLHDLERTFPYPSEPRSARPIDAFVHDGWPRVYDFAVTPEWHQVTLYNNTLPTREETLAVPLAGDTADGALGLDPSAEYHVYDFWNDRYVGKLKGTDTLRETLRPGEARMLSIRKDKKHPQVLSTNRHIMQGYYELSDVKWTGKILTGKAKVVAGDPFKIVIACNGYRPDGLLVADDLAVLTIERPANESVEWSITFK
jgi:hypothetical protein